MIESRNTTSRPESPHTHTNTEPSTKEVLAKLGNSKPKIEEKDETLSYHPILDKPAKLGRKETDPAKAQTEDLKEQGKCSRKKSVIGGGFVVTLKVHYQSPGGLAVCIDSSLNSPH